MGRDPDAIQREIELTRAELADTIDQIADRVSPRRAASRGADKVRTGVQQVFSKETSPNGDGGHREPWDDTTTGAAVTTQRVLRTDRVLIVAGVVAAIMALLVLRRSKQG